MNIYFYHEENGCKNSGKAMLFGTDTEFLNALNSKPTALGAFGEKGDFRGTALCLGNFDGVHKAHRSLFLKASEKGSWGVLLFDRNPKSDRVLTTQKEKIRIISQLGADYVIIAEFSDKFKSRTPEEFVDYLKNILGVSGVVAGFDYRFGHNAEGDTEKLVRLCRDAGIFTEIIKAQSVGDTLVKSTKIREYIKNGDIQMANSLLGYCYSIYAEVSRGLKNGRKMGFPTANLSYEQDKLLPPDGVYAGRCDGYPAVINIGKNPTFDAEERTVEAHLIGFSGNLYQRYMTAEFFEKIRDEIKFESIEELKEQIKRDIEFAEVRYGKENIN